MANQVTLVRYADYWEVFVNGAWYMDATRPRWTAESLTSLMSLHVAPAEVAVEIGE